MAHDCPLCFNKGAFAQWTQLKDSLVSLSTRNFICPLCGGVHEGLDKYILHLVSHEMEAKKNHEEVPTISINEGSTVNSFDELLADLDDFSEFVKQEDTLNYDHQVKLRTKAPNPLRMSPKTKSSPIGLPTNNNYPTIQTPLPLPQTFKSNQNLLMGGTPSLCNAHHNSKSDNDFCNMSLKLPSASPVTTTSAESQTSSVNQLLQSLNNASSPQSTTDQQPKSPPNQVQCSMCGWNFDNDEFLKVHMVLMHSKRNQAILQRRLKRVVDEYKCRECDANFSVYEEYVSHLRQVHNDHRFVCHICAKIFKLRGSLLVHLRVVHNPLGAFYILLKIHFYAIAISLQAMALITAKSAIENSLISIVVMFMKKRTLMLGSLSVPNVACYLKKKASLKSIWRRTKPSTNATFVDAHFTPTRISWFTRWVIRQMEQRVITQMQHRQSKSKIYVGHIKWIQKNFLNLCT